MDNQINKWKPLIPDPFPPPNSWLPPQPSLAELEKFRQLLEEARKQDMLKKQADCGSEEKKRVLKDMAKILGVDISFIEKD